MKVQRLLYFFEVNDSSLTIAFIIVTVECSQIFNDFRNHISFL